ncbi:hypothetical protein DFH29DRAFT_769425, partial [Suillus ampliporus]
DILTKEKGVLPENIPSVAYNTYEAFVIKWGVELAGWTEGEVTNPGNITSSIRLAQLHAALKSGDCYWQILTPAELKAK